MTGVVDRDEYGQPVDEKEGGLYVRFEPGFGLNVHVEIRKAVYPGSIFSGTKADRYEDDDALVLAIGGWVRLCELVDEWRARP